MLDASVPMQTTVEAGDVTWLDTLADLTDPFFLADRGNACAFTYAVDFQPGGGCAFRLHMVLERTDDAAGRIVYSAVHPADVDELAALGLSAPDPECPAYLQCLASTRIGATVVLPQGQWDEMAVHQSKIASWGPNVEVSKMPFYASEIDAGRAKLEEEERTPSIELRLRQLQRQAEYYRAKARLLEEAGQLEFGR